jgi:hypothetical protein
MFLLCHLPWKINQQGQKLKTKNNHEGLKAPCSWRDFENKSLEDLCYARTTLLPNPFFLLTLQWANSCRGQPTLSWAKSILYSKNLRMARGWNIWLMNKPNSCWFVTPEDTLQSNLYKILVIYFNISCNI